MHYFKRNIGDYHKKAGRLSMLQHGAYTLLLDACYDREQFPTMEDALDWVWASSECEIEAVKFVLNKFFVNESGVFIQYRIQDELERYHKNASTNQRIAMEREAKRKEKRTKREQPVNEAPPNQEPLTTNQEPLTTIKTNAKVKTLAVVDSSPVMALIPLTGKNQFELKQTQTDKWSSLYPAVNLQQEINKMIGWLDANPTKRKTARGITKFMNNWLSRAQDSARPQQSEKSAMQMSIESNWHEEDLGL